MGIKKKSFLQELSEVINKHSKENQSNTPDFILARYLEDCLKAFNEAVITKKDWESEND